MKNFLLFFLTFIMFLTLSCAGKPDTVADGQMTSIDEQLAMITEQLSMINEQLAMLKEQNADDDEDAGLPVMEEPDVTAEEPLVEEEPVIEEESLFEEEPIAEEEPVIDEDALAEEEPFTGEWLLAEEESAFDEEPFIEEEPLAEEELFIDEEPVFAENPIVEDELVFAENPMVEEEPVFAENPIVKEEPVIAGIPLVEERIPVVEERPLVSEDSPAGEELKAETEEEPLTAKEDSVPFRRDPVINIPSPASSNNVLVPVNDEVIISRIVHASVGQLIEVPFRGTGWVYLGELVSHRGLAYNSRRYDPEGQSFIFIAESSGAYTLKFFRQDFIRDYILYDHVQVMVDEAPAAGSAGPFTDRTRIVAQPRWPSSLNEAGIQRNSLRLASESLPADTSSAAQRTSQEAAPVERTTQSQGAGAQGTSPAQGTTSTQGTAPAVTQNNAPMQGTTSAQGTAPVVTQNNAPVQVTIPVQAPAATQTQSAVNVPAAQPAASDIPVITTDEPAASGTAAEKQEIPSPEEIIKRAKVEFDAGNTEAAIALLDQYLRYYPSGNDEVYWLLAQCYEANTSSRNIALALDYYRRLVRECPQSSRLSDARRRISYIERFYFNIQ